MKKPEKTAETPTDAPAKKLPKATEPTEGGPEDQADASELPTPAKPKKPGKR